MSDTLAIVHIDFDYSTDTQFQTPAWPYYPNGAMPYDPENIQFGQMKFGFNKVVGAQYGKSIHSLDMRKQGAMRMEGGALWAKMGLQTKRMYDIPQYQGVDNLDPFSVLAKIDLIYDLPPEVGNRPIMLAGTLGSYKYGFILLDRVMVNSISARSTNLASDYFEQYVDKMTLQLQRVALPFPFHCTNVDADAFTSHTVAEGTVKIDVAKTHCIMYGLVYNQTSKGLSIFSPGSNGDALFFDMPATGEGLSPFGHLSFLLNNARDANVITFSNEEKALRDPSKAAKKVVNNRKAAMLSFSGEKLDTVQVYEPIQVSDMPVPIGLEELPALPESQYHYLADMNGIIYITDGIEVLMPHQVFQLPKLRQDLQEIIKKIGTDAATQFAKQLSLIEALFEHQEKVLSGTAFTYKAMAGFKKAGAK